MERFLIDDGIKQLKIVANRYKWSIENADMGSEDANELNADIRNQYVKEYEQIAEWLEELKSYKDIGTLKELKELKENGAFTGLELAKLAIMQKELKKYKDLEEQGLLVRLQCVLCDANTIEDVLNTIDAYSFADDLSFRKLMKLSEKSGIKYDEKEELYNKILEYAYNHFEFIEQTIQDYYVYEIWKYKDILITFSYSNMKMLSEIEKTEDNSVCREFIIHPDGTISGSWNKNMKVIKK